MENYNMRKLLYLVIHDGNIVSSYHNKSQAKDDMITRNADVLTDALEQNEIDDLEIEDIEDVGYDADGFKIGTIDITNINFAEDPGKEIMLETVEGGDEFSIDELRTFIK